MQWFLTKQEYVDDSSYSDLFKQKLFVIKLGAPIYACIKIIIICTILLYDIGKFLRTKIK